MRGLTIVVAGPDRDRFRTALSLAAATAALGARAHLFLQDEAVGLLRRPIAAADDAARTAAGLPTLATCHHDALELGVRFIVCQSGMLLTGTTPADYDADTDYAGIVSILADLGDDRLVVM